MRDPHEDASRTEAILTLSAGVGVVAVYLSRPGEPDTAVLIEELHRRGVRILLPVLTRQPDWAWYAGTDDLVAGPYGIRQPSGARLGAAALAAAEAIWLPGLAGTPRGERLGTGGGWYDRALPAARPDARRGLLLFDDEVRDWLPTDPWDQPVDLVVTERRVITCSDHRVE